MPVAHLSELLGIAVQRRGSDLHLKAGSPPSVRVDGRLQPLDDRGPMVSQELEAIAGQIVPQAKLADLEVAGEADFALSLSGVGRFRVNVHRQRGSLGIVVRRVLPGTPSIDRLGLPAPVAGLAAERDGLVLVSGSAGSGRTTTAAALVDRVNATRRCAILTIEDPVEVLHPDKEGFVVQREVGTDTGSFATALQRAWRQDPDVVYVSELRDEAVVTDCLDLADTGVLVIGTLPTLGAEETLNRLVELVAAPRRAHVLAQLARSLRGVVSQRLLERADGRGRVPAVELLLGTPRVGERLAEGVLPLRVLDLVAEGEYHGMQTFDQSLELLVRSGVVAAPAALAAAGDPDELERVLTIAGLLP